MSNRPKVHFIGIGGIGTSALARAYLHAGWEVSGSDLHSSEITKALEKFGIQYYEGIKSLKTCMPDRIIYSPAIQKDNLELKEACELGIMAMSYPEALGQFAKNYYTIAVAGTHGKSTTASMIALMLVKAGMDPTVVVGTKVEEFGDSNFRYGSSRYLIIEACEYKESFLSYRPQIIIITNIEEEHLDYYENLDEIIKAFRKFIILSPENIVVANQGNINVKELLSETIIQENHCIKDFSLLQEEKNYLRGILRVPGEFNVQNAIATLAVGRILGIPDRIIYTSLSEFKGIWRRFDIHHTKINRRWITIVFDYGHHPTQIRVTLDSARQKWPKRRIICLFQPHQVQRTYFLFDEFVEVLRNAPIDTIIITDIYSVAGRESKAIENKVSAKKLVDAIGKESVYYVVVNQITAKLEQAIIGGEVLIVMGAGDIYYLLKELYCDQCIAP
jgi:UDP-N-acetylmuramate--alanine ligase